MGHKVPWSERTLFLRGLLRHGRRVASCGPSSPSLAAQMCRHVDAKMPQVIIELGAGTGAVTAELCRRVHPESRVIAVEALPEFCAVLRQRAPLAECVNGDAREIPHLLTNVHSVDLVLSGLPTPSLPFDVNAAVYRWLRALPREPMVSQLTVMPWVYLRLYRRLFHEVRFDPVLRNTPPGGVYHCRRLRPGFEKALPGFGRSLP